MKNEKIRAPEIDETPLNAAEIEILEKIINGNIKFFLERENCGKN